MKTLLFAAVLCACGPDEQLPQVPQDQVPPGEVDSVVGSIQGGALDPGDPAVGDVEIEGGSLCTGTLIAPDVVLTAGHCVESRVASVRTGIKRNRKKLVLFRTDLVAISRLTDVSDV